MPLFKNPETARVEHTARPQVEKGGEKAGCGPFTGRGQTLIAGVLADLERLSATKAIAAFNQDKCSPQQE
jgi:hypothetical protein